MESNKSIDINAKISINKNITMGLQHVLTMFPGTIAVPLILGNALNLDQETVTFLIAANLFTSAIAIFIQVIGLGKHIGSRLPIVLGSAFAPLAPMIAIGSEYNLPTVFGAIIGSGVLLFLCTFFMEKLVKFFPPVVIGSFVTLIGITLAPTAFTDLAGGGAHMPGFGDVKNLILGFIVLMVIILLSYFGNELIKNLSILISIVVGTIISIPLGLLDLSNVANAKLFEFIIPFKLGFPEFKIGAIFIMTLFCFVNMIQCFGAYAFLEEVTQHKTTDKQKIDGLRGQSIAQIFSGCFNSFPSSMFNENIGIIKLSGIGAKSTIITAGFIILGISLSPKLCALIAAIPKPVIGGATLGLFGTITAAGISILSSVDFRDNANSIIVGTSIALGVGAEFASDALSQLPSVLSMLLSNGLFIVAFSAVTLNIIFNFKKYFKKEM